MLDMSRTDAAPLRGVIIGKDGRSRGGPSRLSGSRNRARR